ncbi:sugar phosphate isomerase/epimerase [Emticicia sp. C21]|uniref:sugar phosphate isomerase/epimerase family protein n=1 Tax=Emticicia sp. C21 TaxID=2302915 RepID=UPI000E348B79|nr:sugar phosphate isomerase/epimerase family protein [Emticicia sp. C21]RFS16442.1 sugar phosphate isomerase/epimerase [Emticicia sp. C21]
MKFGMNLLLWGTEINESLFPVLEEIKELGFDGVEVPIFDTDPTNWYKWREKLDELELDRIAVTICGPDFNQISPDPAIRKATLERNKLAVDCAMVLGANLLNGPYHSALGAFTGKPASEQEWRWAVDNLRELADYADSFGITLGLEYLNRFESYLVSSSDELIKLVEDIDHPACKIMFDTFHANIEEKNLGDAIRKLSKHLVHVQVSENDRSTVGTGNVNWEDVFKALHEVKYDGWLSVEAFSQKLAVANIWRKMFDSETQLMKDSLSFLKNSLAENPGTPSIPY